MNSMRSGLMVAAVVLGTMTAWAGVRTAGNSGSATLGTAGYTVTVPTGDNWTNQSTADGAVYENVIGGSAKKVRGPGLAGPVGPTAFYRAGFSAAPAPAFSDRQSFLAYVKQSVAETSDTSGYQT